LSNEKYKFSLYCICFGFIVHQFYGLEMEAGVLFIRIIGRMDFVWLGIGWILASFQKKAVEWYVMLGIF